MKKRIKITLIILSVIFLIILIPMSILLYKFLDDMGHCGFDDGPFKAALIDRVSISDSAQTFNLDDNTKLLLDNRNDTLSPLLFYKKNGKLKWTLDLDVSTTKGFENCRITKMNNVVIIDDDPIILEFIGYWSFGAETGHMEIDKETGDNYFCLSW